MKKLTALFAGQKLTTKFTLIIFLIVYIPVLLLTGRLLQNTRETLIREKMSSISLDMEQLNARIQKTAEVSVVLTQTFASNENLISYLSRVKSGESIDTLETINFYRNDIATLSKFVYANAYLSQMRVYADCPTLTEMMPVLYRQDRMQRLKWAQGEDGVRDGWHFDYTDTLFVEYASTRKTHLMALTKTMYDKSGEPLAVVEAAVDMDSLLPSLFKADDQVFLCLTDKQGNYYYDASAQNPWSADIETVLAYFPELPSDATHQRVTFNGHEAVLSNLPLPGIGARLIQVTSLSHEFSIISRQQLAFYLSMTLAMVALIVLIHLTIRLLLRRFYVISRTVDAVETGNLDVRVPQAGHDEISDLGKQINLMLDKINVLMVENTEREVIVKNAEIRALHNQINAHFIYNVLESIKMMAEISEHFQISDAVTSLGKLLRYSMRWTSRNVTIEEEIEYIKNYLSLINLRFDYQICLSLAIPDTLMKQEIPKISLQPIVENAIGHGLEDATEDTYIYIKAYESGDLCVIEVTDPGKGIDEETLTILKQKIEGAVEAHGGSGNGIGLKNVNDRIRVTFGERYGLTVQSQVGMFTKVVVTLPITYSEGAS